MRTLLRHTTTGLYFQGAEKWIANPDSAYDFRFIERVRQFVRIWELEDVEVAFVFEDQLTISTLPLDRMAAKAAA
jgi:predicted nucleotidyltransferase